MTLLDSSFHSSFLNALLAWYKKNGRHDMAWRKTKDPYAIMVSEFMLQQTTVSTVKPYYDRFMKYFPTLKALGESELDDVLALWSGLGYYARARNLWASAKAILERFNGNVPADQKELETLPGIGYYTSGAISSLAFNQPAVVLDGNIIRVFMRLLALDDDPKLKAVQVILRKLSLDLSRSSLARRNGPHNLVLALMDLGASVCTVRSPKCERCPVRQYCLARQYGKQDSIPTREEQNDRPIVRLLSALIRKGDRWLIGQRPNKGLFGGLWEFPSLETGPGIEPIPTLEKWVKEQTGFRVRVDRAIPAFDHQLTHRVIYTRPYLCELQEQKLPKTIKKTDSYLKWAWVQPSSLAKYGVSALTKRIVSKF